jgi:hypothetical protein
LHKGKRAEGTEGFCRGEERGRARLSPRRWDGIDGDMSAIYEAGVNSVFAINCLPEDFSVSRHKSEKNLKATMDNILRVLKI